MKLYGLVIIVGIIFFVLRLFFVFSANSALTPDREITIEVTMLSEPTRKETYQTFSVFANGITRVWVNTNLAEEISYGDHLRITGNLKAKEIEGQGTTVVYSLSYPLIEKKDPEGFIAFFRSLRDKNEHLFSSVLSRDHAGLLLGIVYGIKKPLSEDFASGIKTVGLTHVSAASGMNVTLLAGFLSSILIHFFKRQTAGWVTLLILLGYMVMAGMQASIIRATIMGATLIIAGILGRSRQSVYLLFLTGYVMLFVSPILLYDLGFQLSFLSTLGILLFKPVFDRYVRGIVGIDDLTTTIAAQVLTIPVLIGTFGTYNLVSILVNALVLWVVPPLMIIGAVSSTVGMIAPLIASIILLLTIPFVWYFQMIVIVFARIPIHLSLENVPIFVWIGYYCLTGWGYLKLVAKSGEPKSI